MRYINLFKINACKVFNGRLVTLLLATFIFTSGSIAKTPIFTAIERLSIAEGLPATSVYTLMSDKNGFLWLGTPKGLVRYDGSRFHVFSGESTSDFSIPTTDASNAFIDSKGRFWLGSWGNGISLYDANMQLQMVFKENSNQRGTIGSNKIQAFFEDSKGRIWVGSNGGGLAVFNEKHQTFRSYLHAPDDTNSISHNRVWSITEDKKGRIWVGTTDGLNVLENEEHGLFFRHYHEANNPLSLHSSLIRELYVDDNNRLWVGTESGFGLFDKTQGEFTPLEPENSPINSGITAIKGDSDGNVWVGAQKGLYVFNPEEMRYLPIGVSDNYVLLPQDDLRDVTFDENGILWIATRYGGLAKVQFRPGIFNPFTTRQNSTNQQVPLTQVLSFYQDSLGEIWIGTQTELLRTSSMDTEAEPFQLPALGDNTPLKITGIRNINEAPNGELWIATESGVYVLSKRRDEIRFRSDLVEGLNSPGVNQVLFASDGAVWLALKLEGLLKLHNGQRSHYYYQRDNENSLGYDAIAKIFEDRQKRIWIATNGGGLNQYIPFKDRFIRFEYDESNPNSLSNNNVNDVYQDADNIIWVATVAGLNRLDELTSSFVRYDTTSGMRNSNIKAITEDQSGNIWFSSDFGISEFRLNKQYFVNYGLPDNIHSLEFSDHAQISLKDNRFVFGGRNGYTLINLNYLNQQTRLPETHMTQVWIDRVQQKNLFISNDMPLLELPSGTKDIRFDFSTLDFVNPANNRYQYRLLGLDELWSPTSFEPFARYTGLQHGDYVFEVRGASSAGVWSQNQTQLAFSIVPTIWQSLWFRIAIILLVISASVYWYKYRTRLLKNQKQELEKEIASRTEELVGAQKQLIESEKHHALSGLVAGVAHEINTPVGISITATSTLNDIAKALSESVKEGTVKKKDLIQKVEQISVSTDIILRNLNRAGELVRSFKEVAVDQVSDDRREFDLYEYLEEITISVGPQLRQQNIDVKLNCPKDLLLDNYPGAIAQIMTNLLLNAIVHGLADTPNGHIDITVIDNSDTIKISVSDNGKGIPQNQLRKIFDPFFTTNRSTGAKGLGLHIIQNLINVRLQGKIYCDSVEGDGTSFNMEFRAKPD